MKKVFISILAAALTLSAFAGETARVTIQLTSTNATYGNDELELKENTDRTAAYESGYDAEKMMSQANKHSVLLYAFVGDQPCSTVATNDLDGTVIGFTSNKYDTDYKLVFSNVSGTLSLYDRVTKTSTTIANNGEYPFTATAGRVAVEDRFVINYVAPTYVYMNGDFENPDGEWTSWPGAFTADGSIYSQELTLAADTWYHFKLMEEYSDVYTAADGSSFDRDNNSHNLYVNEFTSALLLHTDVAGTYTFTWNDLTDNLTITFPAAPAPTCTEVRNGLNVDQYYTICLPKAVESANGASFWNMTNRGDGVAYLVEAELPLVAGRPYIIQAEATELCVVYSGEDAVAGTFGALHGTFAAMDQAALDLAGSDIYLLKNNELWLVSGQTGNSLAANRAYIKYNELVVSTPSPAPGRRVRAIPMQNQGTTGVENLNASEAPVKTVIDGKLYIIRGEHMFDATGRMVK